MVLIKTVFIAFAAYCYVLFLVRVVGRKTMSQLTFFDFILGVTLGTLTANVVLGPDRISALLSLTVFSLLTVAVDYLHIKSFAMRKLLDSEPLVLIENGKIIDQNLRKTRLSLDELQMQLRQKNVFNIGDVEFAVIETNGKVSVLPRSQKQPLTPSDLGIPTAYKGLTRDIIIDGHIMYDNLYDAYLDESWLLDRLKEQGVRDVKNVVYAGLDTVGNLHVSEKYRQGEHEGKHGIE